MSGNGQHGVVASAISYLHDMWTARQRLSEEEFRTRDIERRTDRLLLEFEMAERRAAGNGQACKLGLGEHQS